MRSIDRLLAALDRDIGHGSDLLQCDAAWQRRQRRAGAQHDVDRRAGTTRDSAARQLAKPAGSPSTDSMRGRRATLARSADSAGHVRSAGTCRISVAAVSGASCVPAGRASPERRQRQAHGESRTRSGVATIGAPQWNPIQSRCSRGAGIQPDRRIVIQQGQQHRGGRRRQRRRRRQVHRRPHECGPAAPSHPARRESMIARRQPDRRSPAASDRRS